MLPVCPRLTDQHSPGGQADGASSHLISSLAVFALSLSVVVCLSTCLCLSLFVCFCVRAGWMCISCLLLFFDQSAHVPNVSNVCMAMYTEVNTERLPKTQTHIAVSFQTQTRVVWVVRFCRLSRCQSHCGCVQTLITREGRKEEGRRKKEEGRRKEEGGRRREEGRERERKRERE